MRRPALLFMIGTAAVLCFLLHHVWTLLSLLVVDGARDAISRDELAPSAFRGPRKPLIPKIIHQTWKNTSIPAQWKEPRQMCLDLHSENDGWQWMLWTDDRSREFIADEYPWFLATYDSYDYTIERADAIRYFVLAHYGGIYLDMDIGCRQDLEPLLYFPAWARITKPTGISNNAIGAMPGHPFFTRVIESMASYKRGWIFPYITVMASTGPLFLSVIWRRWDAEGHNIGDEADGGRVRLLFPQEYTSSPWSFFAQYPGSSWHRDDARLIFWLNRHWILVTVIGFVIGFTVLGVVWLVYARLVVPSSDSTQTSSPSSSPQMQQGRSWNLFAGTRPRSKSGVTYVKVDQYPV